jgi:hypothetical protein
MAQLLFERRRKRRKNYIFQDQKAETLKGKLVK